MKKIGLGIVGLALIAAIYYFTSGSEQVTVELKNRVNSELTMIEQNGFTIQEREVKEKEEHFVLSFDDPEKIAAFFKQQGSEIAIEDAQALIGMKIGVDLKYLLNSYSALSVDMYPLNLPPAISNTQDLEEADKALIKQLNSMLKRKAFLIHVDFNKLLSSFKGHIKDIHETFTVEVETVAQVNLEGATFEGSIKEDTINTITQNIKRISIKSGDELDMALNDLNSHFKLTGKSAYNSVYDYKIASLSASGKKENNTFSVSAKKISGNTETSVKSDLVSNTVTFNVSDIEMVEDGQKTKLETTSFAFKIDNLDMNVLKKIENTDVNNEAERTKLMQALISKGITMEIPSFEVKKIEYMGKEIDGFSLTSTFNVNKATDLTAIQENPFAALNAVNTKTKIVLSDALFTLIAQQPRGMMLAMIIQPQVVNGKKVYELELKDGKLIVNGKPMM